MRNSRQSTPMSPSHGPKNFNLSWQEILSNAASLENAFSKITKSAPYEPKGVLFSEILFVAAVGQTFRPGTVYESGRAAGVSTYLLSEAFPSSQIISIERDENSADVQVARSNLSGLKNVTCLFGDSRKMLANRVKPGDFVVIDGPKEYRALKLAFSLLRKNKPAAIFIHDCHLGSVERSFLQKHMPKTFYSDDAFFTNKYKYLDSRCWEKTLDMRRQGINIPCLSVPGHQSYGPTFALLTPSLFISSRMIFVKIEFEKLKQRVFPTLRKKLFSEV